MKPGIYLNHNMVALSAYGPEIHVGPDAFPLFHQLQADQAVRIERLRRMLTELADLRELTVGIAD